MDKVTTQMCNDGTSRLSYARVLVEVNAKDDLKDRIKVCCKEKNKVTVGIKFVGVEYAWKPPKCSHCAIFGHEHSKCEFNPKRMKEKDNQTQADSKKEKITDKEGFVQFRPIRKEGQNSDVNNNDNKSQNEKSGYQTPNRKKEWKVAKDVIDAIRKSANKYSVLEDQKDDETLGGITLDEKGDWNVSLNVIGHSAGGSCKIADILDFQECLEDIKVEDINWSGLHFTWIQSRLDPSNGILKKIDRVLGNAGKKEANILKEYCKAVSDEEKLLFQQAKIDWLKDRDINSKFFHAFLKCRRNKSIIYMVQNELGESFYDDKVPEKCHSFQRFPWKISDYSF
ncbi:hypothetical protein Tco_0899127 [Tanacetum coccineum]